MKKNQVLQALGDFELDTTELFDIDNHNSTLVYSERSTSSANDNLNKTGEIPSPLTVTLGSNIVSDSNYEPTSDSDTGMTSDSTSCQTSENSETDGEIFQRLSAPRRRSKQLRPTKAHCWDYFT
jgi:hypothetical protein